MTSEIDQQGRAARALVTLIELAKVARLPTLRWSIGPTGTVIVGEATCLDKEQCCIDFEVWCSAIEAHACKAASTTELRAYVTDYQGQQVSVLLVAKLGED